MQQSRSVHASNLPRQFTPFIGREHELAELGQMLADPACRLLTLIGPGGIGKTRLAIQVASALTSHFADGEAFVNLQPVTSADFIVPAIAHALNFPLSGPSEPLAQLTAYLSNRDILLLMDNAEHLLAGMSVLSDLLRETQGMKVLVTSRHALNLMGEWLYSVNGLPLPLDTAEAPTTLDAYSAIRLFIACARRMRPRFSVSDVQERDGVLRICRLVEGTPLAIELAAAWVKTLSCADIADELQRNLDLLTTSARDMPERHRSMQAVFEQSWHMLTSHEREVYKRLSVFHGGFRRDAAEKIAGKSACALYHFYQFQGHYREGADLLDGAARCLENSETSQKVDFALAEVLTWLGWMYIDLGLFQRAKTVVERSLDIYQRLGMPHPPGSGTDPLTVLGFLAYVMGDYAEATRLSEQSCQLNESQADKGNLMYALHNLTYAMYAQGEYAAAEVFAQRTQAVVRARELQLLA